MKFLIFLLGYLVGKIVTDIQVLFELKEVEINDKKNPRIKKKKKRARRNEKGIFSNERSINF